MIREIEIDAELVARVMRSHDLPSEQAAVDLALRRLDASLENERLVAAVVAEYFRSANAEDWEAFGRTWTGGAELIAVGGPPRHGRDDVVRAYRLFLGLFGRHEDRVERLIVEGRCATVLGTFSGTNPQGVAIEFPWMDLIELDEREQAIRRLWHWHDRDRFRKLMAADA